MRPIEVSTTRRGLPAGDEVYSEWCPPGLDGLVELIWEASGPASVSKKRIFPNGSVELLVNLGGPLQLVQGPGIQELKRSWLCGMRAGPLAICVRSRFDLLGLRLTPSGARALFGRPLSQICGRTIDLEELLGGAASELAELCLGAVSIDQRFERASEWAARRVRDESALDATIRSIAERIRLTGGRISIRELREESALSRTRLASAFKDQIGVTPKRYARIIRFRRLLAMLHANRLPLSELAMTAGFYDQPHMNGEFRRLGGLTPRQFLANSLDALDLGPVEALGIELA